MPEIAPEVLGHPHGSLAAIPTQPSWLIQGDTKKRELLKCVVAAMYSWQHCGTGTLSYRQPFLKGKL